MRTRRQQQSEAEREPKRARREWLAALLQGTGVLRCAQEIRRRFRTQPLSVLAYHRLVAAGSVNPYADNVVEGDEVRFRQQLKHLSRGRDVIGLAGLRSGLADPARFPRSPLMITFDDGYRSCVEIALPILQELKLSATFFIATRFIEERRMYWWDAMHFILKRTTQDQLDLDVPIRMRVHRRDPGSVGHLVHCLETTPGLDTDTFVERLAIAAGVPWSRDIERAGADELLMTWEDVERLRAAGMDIAAHSRTHRVLQTLSDEELRAELRGCREELARFANVETQAIAYPSGYAIAEDARVRAALLAAGFSLGFAFGGGRNARRGQDWLDIRRHSVDSALSDTMHRMQLILPSLGYMSARTAGLP